MKKFNFHIKPIGLLDMLHFKEMVPRRRAILKAGSLEPITANYAVNRLAKSLHPKEQKAVVSEIITRKDASTYVLKADKLAYFRAGQYVSVKIRVGNAVTARPYTLAASPAKAFNGEYQITVKKAQDGFVSEYILANWKVGTEVTLSGPEGPFSYEPIRDEAEVVGLAGGSGITPFMAMAYAILDGTEDFRLTLIYGSRTKKDILYAKELEQICAETDKVRVIHVLSEEKAKGYEHGFISAELIKRYAPETYTLYICGPRAMHDFLADELPKLGLDQKHIRREFVPAPGSPEYFKSYAGDPSKVFSLKLQFIGEERIIPLRADEPVLTAIDRAGIAAPSHCRSGECGWCRSRLISGDVFVPESMDGRRMADSGAGYIHPCSSWALSDLELEIFPEVPLEALREAPVPAEKSKATEAAQKSEEPVKTESIADNAEYQKIVDYYTDKSGSLSYDLINKDMIKFLKSSSIARKMLGERKSEEIIRLYVVGTKFRTITGNKDLTDEWVLKLVELLDEAYPKGVLKEFNTELRKVKKALKELKNK